MLATVILWVVGVIVASVVILALAINYAEARYERDRETYHPHEHSDGNDG